MFDSTVIYIYMRSHVMIAFSKTCMHMSVHLRMSVHSHMYFHMRMSFHMRMTVQYVHVYSYVHVSSYVHVFCSCAYIIHFIYMDIYGHQCADERYTATLSYINNTTNNNNRTNNIIYTT
eukprot:GHVS01026238.1.p1 GENE.GHVS01026238.1~~GHVS01026238.1.p1  ORF type:complete len:119 (-),score=7.44 GHVS01026238.1:91-447(-)